MPPVTLLRPFLLGLGGVLLLLIPASRFRIDRLQCAGAPPLSLGLLYFLVYLLGLGLLALGWRGMVRAAARERLGRVLLLGALLHACALLCPPFLSNDPLYYAAVGRALARTGQHDVPLSSALPAGDPFLTILPVAWQHGTSPYFPGFNLLAEAVSRVGGEHLWVHLRLYQFLGLLSMVLGAGLVGCAAGARGAALVLFCPLAVIEGTLNAHNDSLLLLTTALFVLCVARRRKLLALLALLPGLLVKVSALLLLLLYPAALLVPLWRARLTPVRRAAVVLAGSAAGLLLLRSLWPLLMRYPVTRLLGNPADPVEFCTRAVECLPRAFLRWVLHAPRAAFAVGLFFRTAALVFAAWVVSRAARDRRYLAWSATFLFFYYLYLHAYSQPWYLLSLLPLLPYAPPRLLPAMVAFCLSSLSYYAADVPFDCDLRVPTLVAEEIAQALIVIIPPSLVLLRGSAAPGAGAWPAPAVPSRPARPVPPAAS